MSYANCIVSGENPRITPEPKDTGPPEGFIDQTVRVYKMIDGVKTLIRIDDPFPEGWDKPGPFMIANKAESDERRGNEMAKKVKLEAPTNLEQVWIESNYVIDKLAKTFGCGWGTARGWLQEAGLIDTFGTRKMQTSDPAQAATKEPDQSEASAETSISEQDDFFCPKCGFIIPQCQCNPPIQYEPEPQDDFTVDDDEPIPYKVFDLAPVKIQLIAAALAEYRAEQLPAFITLRLVKAIGDIELGVE